MEYPGSVFLSPAIPEGQAIGRMLLQYRETDWAFLKRVASRSHAVLIPDILGNAPRFSVGPMKQQAELQDGSHVVAKRDASWYQAALGSGLEAYEEQYIYHLHSRQRLNLGD